MSLDSRNTVSSEDSAQSVIHIPLRDGIRFTDGDTDTTTDLDSEADFTHSGGHDQDYQHDGSTSDSETDLSEMLRMDSAQISEDSSSSSENTEIWIPNQPGGLDHHPHRSKPTPPPRPTNLSQGGTPVPHGNPQRHSNPPSVRHSIVSQNSLSGRVETVLAAGNEPIYVNGDSGICNMSHDGNTMPSVTEEPEIQHSQSSQRLPSPPQTSILRNRDDVMVSHIQVQKDFRNFLHTILSCLYAVVLAVSGIVLPIGEAFTDQPGPGVEIYYIYMYIVGIGFLVSSYIFMLKRSSTRRLSRRRRSCDERDPLKSPKSPRRRKRKLNPEEQQAIGSFYLRLGAVGFGVGAMIHEGLMLGELLEGGLLSPCVDAVKVTRTIVKLTFIFIQLYTVFLNAKINMQRHAMVAKYGLMHLMAVNLCLWSRTVVDQTLRKLRTTNDSIPTKMEVVFASNGNYTGVTGSWNVSSSVLASKDSCHGNGILGQVVRSASCYLYPCSVEYALIALGILMVMWLRLTKQDSDINCDQDSDYVRMKRNSTASVDCSQANRGMFLGIFMLVVSIIAMILFFVLTNRPGYGNLAFMVAHTTEVVLYIIATIAVCAALQRMHDMLFTSSQEFSLDEMFMWISLTGVLANAAFSILPARYNPNSQGAALGILRAVVTCIQAAFQTVFIMCTMRRSPCKPHHEMEKPGRELITFLIACNIAMWGLNTLEDLRGTSSPLAMSFFGLLAWSIFKHLTTPLAIFYRFHSTVCLANIWKSAYKVKSH